jgi:hypothetical protein
MPNTVDLKVETLGDKFIDFRDEIYGNSFSFGPIIDARNVQFLTFHHEAVERKKHNYQGGEDWKRLANGIAAFHVDHNGWAGIGYHFLIMPDGKVIYVSDLSHGAANVANHNDINFGACFIGDFTKELPTDEQIMSAHLLAEWLLEQTPQYPNLNDWDRSIRGHKDWGDPKTGVNVTACPGSSWPDDMKYRIKYGVPYTPPAPVSVTPSAPVTPPVATPAPTNEVPGVVVVEVPPTETPITETPAIPDPTPIAPEIPAMPYYSPSGGTGTPPAYLPAKKVRHIDQFMAFIQAVINFFYK